MNVPSFRPICVAAFAVLMLALNAPQGELRAQTSPADSVRHRSDVRVAAARAEGALSALLREHQDPPHLRNDCRLAAQILITGPPAPHYGWATETIPRCTQTGGPAVAAAWARPPVGDEFLEGLVYASYTLRDARITNAVTAATLNQSLPQMVRLNAIRVLTGHAVPSFMLAISDLTPVENDSVRIVLGGISHVSVTEGAQPIGPETVAGIVATLAQLELDPDARVAHAASYVKRQICGRLRCAACRQG